MEKVTVKKEIKTYVFKILVEPDEDRWFVSCPILEDRGAATWGYTRQEALNNIKEVLQITVESMSENGESIPEENGVIAFSELWVSVKV